MKPLEIIKQMRLELIEEKLRSENALFLNGFHINSVERELDCIENVLDRAFNIKFV